MKRESITYILAVIILAVFLPLVTPLSLEAASQELSLRDAVHIGLEHNLQAILARLHKVEKEEIYELAQASGDEDLKKRAAEELREAREALLDTKEQLIQAIESSYFRILQEEDQLKVQREALKRNTIQIEADELRYEAGEISTRDITMSRNTFRDLKKTYEEAQEEATLARMEFNHLLGQDLFREFELEHIHDFQELQIDPEKAYELALEHREDVRRAREALKEAREKLKSMDNPFHAPIRITQAENTLLKEKIALEQLKTSLFFEIQRACQSLIKAFEGIEKAREDLMLKERDLKSQTLQYEAGLISTQKIMEAQLELVRAENRIVQAKWNYNSTRLDLERGLGLWSIDEYLEGVDFQLIIPKDLLPKEEEE